MTLTADHFADFFRTVNGGRDPFPWQQRLVQEVAGPRRGYWPPVLALPTGAGKTSTIDAAVFLLALEVVNDGGKRTPRPLRERCAAVRTFFVVDRRIVVDEAGEKARARADPLNAAGETPEGKRRVQAVVRELRGLRPEEPDPLTAEQLSVVTEVAARLRAFGGGKALHVSVLRGGMYRDGSWAEAPNQPTVCLSTVDQVGSRLLFRGYGVGPHQRAVHAGLVGNDALIVVDEAHLSRPFLGTLKAVEFYRSGGWADCPLRTPFQAVVMSATVGDGTRSVLETDADRVPGERRFELRDEDKTPEHLGPRLTARKLARLEEVSGGDDDEEANRREFAEKLAGLARELAGLAAPPAATGTARPRKGASPTETAPEARVVGVVVNRVDTARRVFDLLHSSRPVEAPGYDVILLTGRIRPYDRDRLLFSLPIPAPASDDPDRWVRGWLPFLKARSARPAPPAGKLFVVATQTIEVGADFSFDALVTEAAPLDALRQRFGRVDRLGLRQLSNAVIVARKDLLQQDDPVYGGAIGATWEWLQTATKANRPAAGKGKRGAGEGVKGVDFGINALSARLPTDTGELAALCSPLVRAPVLLPVHVDSWVQTTIPPVPDPDPAVFLHGPQSGPADVSVVWRADLTRELLSDEPAAAIDTVALLPPSVLEALPLPAWVVRDWLRGRPQAGVADAEGEQEPPPAAGCRPGAPFLLWCGPDPEDGTAVTTEPDEIRPGDIVVVPGEYGGCDEFGWNPVSMVPVIDVADDCSWRGKRKPVLRVHSRSRVQENAITVWATLDPPLPPDAAARVREVTEVPDPDTDVPDWDSFARGVTAGPGPDGDPWRWLRRNQFRSVPYPPGRDGSSPGVILVARRRHRHPAEPAEGRFDRHALAGGEAPAGGDGDSFTDPAAPVRLGEHCEGVAGYVRAFAVPLGVPEELIVLLDRAARLHDAGKADPRFQEWLYGSEAVAAGAGYELIAKSSRVAGNDRAAISAARRRAGWPKGARHEALSALLTRDNPAAVAGVTDPELLVYLIGSHHGCGRPLWDVILDDDLPGGAVVSGVPSTISCELGGIRLEAPGCFRPESALAPLGSGWIDLFWALVRRYGYWGLSYLETLLVLADHRRSEAERAGGGGSP